VQVRAWPPAGSKVDIEASETVTSSSKTLPALEA
jgi:hypothetical protein